MKYFLLASLLITTVIGKNRPYNDVVKELKPKSCKQKKENLFLSKDQRAEIEKLSETKLYGGLALRYVTTCSGGRTLYHYVDSHIVRTLNETVVITIEDDQVASFTLSSFNEPPEYIAPKKWYKQFHGQKFGKVLRAQEQVDGLSGATLTANASISTVNNVFALHKILANQSQ